MDLKGKISNELYDELARADMLSDIEDIIDGPALVSFDLEDLVKMSNNEIVGSISQVITNIDEPFDIKFTGDKEPNECLFYIASGYDLNLWYVSLLVEKLRDVFEGIEIVFGTIYDPRYDKKVKVQALLMYNKNQEEQKEKDLEIKRIKMKNLLEQEKKKEEESSKRVYQEKELLYEVALYCVDNPIAVSDIQEKFEIGFTRVSRILERLEKLEIISIKIGDKPREILITDKELIKEIIDKIGE